MKVKTFKFHEDLKSTSMDDKINEWLIENPNIRVISTNLTSGQYNYLTQIWYEDNNEETTYDPHFFK